VYASLPTIGPSSEYLSAWPCRAAPERSVRRNASSSRHLRVDATDAVSLFTHVKHVCQYISGDRPSQLSLSTSPRGQRTHCAPVALPLEVHRRTVPNRLGVLSSSPCNLIPSVFSVDSSPQRREQAREHGRRTTFVRCHLACERMSMNNSRRRYFGAEPTYHGYKSRPWALPWSSH
jgi:hypothetical protein